MLFVIFFSASRPILLLQNFSEFAIVPPAAAFAPIIMRNFSIFISVFALTLSAVHAGYAQETYPVPQPASLANAPQIVRDIRIEGNHQKTTTEIIRVIKSRPERPFSKTVLEEDKRALMQKKWFVDVITKVDRTPEGYIITFQCIERQLINYIKVVGNKKHSRKVLLEEAYIQEGDTLDSITVHQAAERMAQFYRESGYHHVHVEVVIGDEPGDRGVIFRISEGPKQMVLDVAFEGNRIATSARLQTLIQSKPAPIMGPFWLNDFTRKKLDDDVETLTNYYRKLGFFYAKVDRVFTETNGYTGLKYFTVEPDRAWVKVKFIIDEGPQCKIRNITFVGNNRFSQEALLKKMKLAGKKNQYYNQDMLEGDIKTIKEMYGDEGNVFAQVQPDPRIDQDYVDLVIHIFEGPRCYLDTLDVKIIGRDGSESYTKWHPVLSRVSLRPGELLRTSEINASRRRLMASGLFNVNPTQGMIPDFKFEIPKEFLEDEAAEQEAEMMASGDPLIRGQAPQRDYVPPPAYAPSSVYAQSAYYTPPMLAQSYPPQPQATPSPYLYPGTNTANGGSLAPAPAPLQMQDTATARGMTPVQFRPEANTATILGNPYSTMQSPSEIRFDPDAPFGASKKIYPIHGDWILQEAQTGSLMVSLAVSSDSGLMGRFVFDEQNFDILNIPKGFRLSDWRNAFRGKGQRFRVEAMPGTQVSRYSAMWENPYWLDLDYSFGVSGSYYQRYHSEWLEDRTGGMLSFGKLWTPDISTRLAIGGQNVNIHRAMQYVYDEGVVGRHPMYNIELKGTYDTRDSEYMPTEGHVMSAAVEQVLGDYQFIRGNVDLRKYFTLRQRPDRSGRWVLGLRSSLGVTEGGTPIFERYFGGGFADLRGFEYRGVSPRTPDGYVLGGCMEFYNSAEMIFPLTADDMIRGSVFIDTGTVESSLSKREDNYRVAVGFGLRLTIPMMGPAPIALDFAFPLSSGRYDDKQVFSFGMTFLR